MLQRNCRKNKLIHWSTSYSDNGFTNCLRLSALSYSLSQLIRFAFVFLLLYRVMALKIATILIWRHNITSIKMALWTGRYITKYEPRHDKTNKMSVRPAKTQVSLVRVFAVRSTGSQGPKLSSCGQRRLWSDWADAQAGLSLRWAHTHFVGFVMSWLIWYLDDTQTTESELLPFPKSNVVWLPSK